MCGKNINLTKEWIKEELELKGFEVQSIKPYSLHLQKAAGSTHNIPNSENNVFFGTVSVTMPTGSAANTHCYATFGFTDVTGNYGLIRLDSELFSDSGLKVFPVQLFDQLFDSMTLYVGSSASHDLTFRFTGYIAKIVR